jgi:SAM-dependent methyltransferase
MLVGQFRILECSSCQLRFSDPMQTPGVEWYEQSSIYSQRRESNKPVSINVAKHDWRYRSFFSLNLNPGGKILEIGCGNGTFLRLAADRGYQVAGIDADPSAVKTAREINGILNTQSLSVEEFIADTHRSRVDVICLFDVLEHLERPREIVQALGRLLAPGGHLVCTVPSHQRWPQWFASDVDLPPHHLTLWSELALEQCFNYGDLEPVLIRRSPLLGEHLLDQAGRRWDGLQRSNALGMVLRGIGRFLVMPVCAWVLSVVPKAGGFPLLGVSCRQTNIWD